MLPRPLLLLVLGLLPPLGLAGCGEPRAADSSAAPRAVTILDEDGSPVPFLAVAASRGGTGRLVLVDPRAPARALGVLAPGMSAQGDPVVSYDGTRVVFTGRRGEREPWRIWSCAAAGDDVRLEVDALDDLAWPALLSDGRIAYAAVISRPGPVTGWEAAWALHVAPGGGEDGRRITFGAGCDVGPVALRDGRLLYGSWQPGGERSGRGIHLYTVHPDGTGAERLPGPEGTRVYSAWRVLDDGRIAVTADGAVYVRGARGGSWTREESPRREGPTASAAVSLAPRTLPQGHLSVVDEEVHHGDLLALDARHAEAGGARVRLRALAGPYVAGQAPVAETLGAADLHEDGSFFVRVPADTPLLLDLLDASGRVVVEGETPFWVRPNETRACVGCHEDPRTAPPNRRPLAVRSEPQRMLGAGGAR